jgi:DNA-binding NtrC family response regulator
MRRPSLAERGPEKREGEVSDHMGGNVFALRQGDAPEATDFAELIGESEAFRAVREEIARALNVDYPVLITGETGTGKDLAAWLLHHRGPRREGPLVCVNCAALPDTLVESELFGHRRGAFTGADRDAPGLFDAARGGTLLLDEVHQLSLSAQAKLLRAVDTGEYLPLGEARPRRSDARLIAATNADLADQVAAGTFRRDLYYRLHVLTLKMPSLRAVPGDIPRIAAHFVRVIAERAGAHPPEISSETMAALVAAPWPGNVRQLIHELERALLRANGSLLVGHLSPDLQGMALERADLDGMKERVAQAWELDQIRKGLERTSWNVTRLAQELGVSRRGLTGKIARYGLRRPERLS